MYLEFRCIPESMKKIDIKTYNWKNVNDVFEIG